MRKAVFVVLIVLGMAVPVSAQSVAYIPQTWDGVYYRIEGNYVQMLTADNLGMVRGLTDQLRRAGYRSLAQDLRWNGNAYGLPMANGGFYPMYDRNRKPMGSREAAITGAAIGAAIGYGVAGNTRGTAIGAAGGAIVGLMTRRGKNQQNNNGVIVTPPTQPQQNVRIAPDGTPVALPDRPRGSLWGPGTSFGGGQSSNCMQVSGQELTLQNLGNDPLKVFVEGNYRTPVAVLQPREWECADPNLHYEAQTLQTAVGGNGWVGGTQNVPRKPEAKPGLVLVWR